MPPAGAPRRRDRRDIHYWKCDRPAAFHGTSLQHREQASKRAAELLQPLLRHHFDDPEIGLQDAGSQGNHLTFKMHSRGRSYFVRVEDGPEQDDYMEVEAAVIAAVTATGVPTAEVVLADSSWTRLPLAYQVIAWLPHPDLNHWFRQGKLNQPAVARQIGSAVGRWQSIQPAGFGPLDPDRLRRTSQLVGLHDAYRSYFRLNLDAQLGFLVDRGFLSSDQSRSLLAQIDRHNDLLQLSVACLVHKDLALWNVLGTPARVEAVIDWDDTIAGDPTDDLSLLGCFHDHAFLGAALDGYRQVRPLPEDFDARFWLHLLRNMIVKATIRVGAGYFDRGSGFFLNPTDAAAPTLRQITEQRLWLAHDALASGAALNHFATVS